MDWSPAEKEEKVRIQFCVMIKILFTWHSCKALPFGNTLIQYILKRKKFSKVNSFIQLYPVTSGLRSF